MQDNNLFDGVLIQSVMITEYRKYDVHIENPTRIYRKPYTYIKKTLHVYIENFACVPNLSLAIYTTSLSMGTTELTSFSAP